MVLYGDVTWDSRVQREAITLAEAGFDVTVLCLAGSAPSLPPGVRIAVVRPTCTRVLPGQENPFFTSRANRAGRLRSLARRVGWLLGYLAGLWSWGRRLRAAAGPVDVWHAHDLAGLVALDVAVGRTGATVVYDAHELFVESGTAARLPSPVRRLMRAYERRLVARTALVVTVNDELAAVLRRRTAAGDIVVVHNCPPRWTPPEPRPALLARAAGVHDDVPMLLYHGALSVNRGIEQLLEALLEPDLAVAHLALLGYGELRDVYLALADDPRWVGRVHVLPPVAPQDLLPWIASADLGVMPIQPSTLNHRLSTPNKLFECLAAGTPVVTSDFPAMRRIVEDPAGPLGRTCDPRRPAAIAAAVRGLLDDAASDRQAMRARCLAAAHERWNWESEAAGLVARYRELSQRRLRVTNGTSNRDR